MNDVEFILKEDIKEKKQAGRGYYHKKNGSKSNKCRLPSDSLSKKEIEKMNGECKVYNLNKPMSYSNFCAMPVDLQIKYLEMLRDKFGANQNEISFMMGCNCATLKSHKQRFLNGKPEFKRYTYSRLDKDAWRRFINGEKAEDTVDAEPDEELSSEKSRTRYPEGFSLSGNSGTCNIDNSVDTTYLPYNKVISKADIVNGSMNLKGKAEDIFRKMTDILGCENEYEIYVCFKSINK